jgi:hypothetical protein
MRLLLFILCMFSLFDIGDSRLFRRRRAAARRRLSLIKSKSASPTPGPTPTQGPHEEL